MSAPYTKLPSKAKAKPTPFKAHISDEKLEQMIQLAKLSPIGPETHENHDTSRKWGMNRDWLIKAKDRWTNGYDWRKTEARINSFPNYTLDITDDDGTKWTIQFLALFSDNEDAIPVGFFHGWPGSILEFLDLLDVAKAKYTPDKLPYHLIVPSLPGYAFSSGPPVSKNADAFDLAEIPRKLMHALGFGDGFVAQGGDLGAFISKRIAQIDPSCKAFHLNEVVLSKPPKNHKELPMTAIEKKWEAKGQNWEKYGQSYAQEHGNRTGTIGLTLSASPIAMLSWIGEKFLEWSDTDPSVDQILDSISLYWLTDTFPRCIFPYRTGFGPESAELMHMDDDAGPHYKDTPMGFSWMPLDLVATPVSWAATHGKLVWYRRHSAGGHFAAMEKPKEIFADVEEFLALAWEKNPEALQSFDR